MNKIIGRQNAGDDTLAQDIPLAQDIQEAFSIFRVLESLLGEVGMGHTCQLVTLLYKVDGTKSGCQVITIFLTKIAILRVPRCQTRLGPILSSISDMTQMTG